MAPKVKSAALSAAEARRIVLHAQGFYAGSNSANRQALLAIARQLGAIQIDSVNVLVRSHYLPIFSRVGAYDRSDLEALAYRAPRRLFEYWAHEASFVPLELYPLFGWRRERARSGLGTWKHVSRVGLEEKALVKRVRAAFERGPLAASDFEEGKGSGSWWGWNDTKRAVEYLFWCGDLAVVRRRSSFEREYDLTERVIPKRALDAPEIPAAEQQRRLLLIAARALGVATQADLRDYFRLPAADFKPRVQELVEAGDLRAIVVENWPQTAYTASRLHIPGAHEGSALLSPFDSLVWNRERTHRLFDFHYRIEIYTPAHKRIHGYYVLPYLVDEALAARVDLKADRAARTLRVIAVHYEPGVKRREVRVRLRADLAALADWLGLERGVVEGHDDKPSDMRGSKAMGSR